MLEHRSYHATPKERKAVESLLQKFRESGTPATVSRSGKGESGPLRVEVTTEVGSQAWLVHPNGKIEDLSPMPGTSPA